MKENRRAELHTIADLGAADSGLPDGRLAFLGKGPCRVHIAGLGDVGRNVALGFALTGGGQVSSVGLFDLNEAQCRRMETELSQIAPPPGSRRPPVPAVRAITAEEMFDCDVFLFCATKAVPEVGSAVTDVRMAQYEANRGIVAGYAAQAAAAGFTGLFGVVSDPVDLLCAEALRASRAAGEGLHPQQVRGFGLGVMNARAQYHARRDARFSAYLRGGRAFGPHGQDLVIAVGTGPGEYDDPLSRELTALTVRANLEVRALGFKPYLAPAMSSAVLSLLALLAGEWHYSAAYLGGVYFGALNRLTPEGTVWEETPLADALYERLAAAYAHLRAFSPDDGQAGCTAQDGREAGT